MDLHVALPVIIPLDLRSALQAVCFKGQLMIPGSRPAL